MFLSSFASSPTSPSFLTLSLTLLGPKTGTASDKIFFNEENQKDLILAFEKIKCILFEDLIEAIELDFENLGMKNLASFYKMKNMAGLNQHWAFKKRYL